MTEYHSLKMSNHKYGFPSEYLRIKEVTNSTLSELRDSNTSSNNIIFTPLLAVKASCIARAIEKLHRVFLHR